MGMGALSGLFSGYMKQREIEKSNEALVEGYKAYDDTLEFAQRANLNRSYEAMVEIQRVTDYNIEQSKLEMAQKGSAVAMSEGITAGASKGRQLQTMFLQQNVALGESKAKGESMVNKLFMEVESQNNQMQQQKVEAFNRMKAGLVTGTDAALQIATSTFGGAMQGYNAGQALGAASPTTKSTANTLIDSAIGNPTEFASNADGYMNNNSGGSISEYFTTNKHVTSRGKW